MRACFFAFAAALVPLCIAACAGDETDDPVTVIAGEKKGGAGGAAKAGSGGGGRAAEGEAGAPGTAGNPGEGGQGGEPGAAGEAGAPSEGGSAGKGGSAGAGGKGGSSGKAGASGQAGAANGGSEQGGAGGEGEGGSAQGGSEQGGAGGKIENATRATITALAAGSSCYKYSWKDRGKAPKGYIEGMALLYARAVCQIDRSDVAIVKMAKTGVDEKDALSWYDSNFAALGMQNDVAGIDTLRHAYTLLTGLGMRESSGQHCEGRDAAASNVSSDSAEAGGWQTSYDSRGASAELPKLFEKYKADSSGCLLETFAEGVSCSASDAKNWGTGADGLEFQKLSKECPAFAAEYAAVMLRVLGGSKGHYGPLRTKSAEIRQECDSLFQSVQTIVEDSPDVCGAL